MLNKHNNERTMNIIFKYEYLEHQWLAIQRVADLLLCPSFNVGNEMTGYGHILTSRLSKLRSCHETDKKQFRVMLEYVFNMVEMFLYSSFGALLMFLGFSLGGLDISRRRLEEGSKFMRKYTRS